MKVALVPLGDVPDSTLRHLADDLAGRGIVCVLRTSVALSTEAWSEDSGKYRAEAVLAALRTEGGERTLAVTSGDLFVEGWEFVFGFADLGACAAVVSLARLSKGGRSRERLAKEAIHELGHLEGLSHCPDARCVMTFSESLTDADAKTNEFCDACRARLPRAMG